MGGSKRSSAPAAANRGCLSVRQWADIRQAAQLAREQGVNLKVHGVVVFSTDSPPSAGHTQSEVKEKPAAPRRASGRPQPMDSVGEQPVARTKKQQRDAQRLADHREQQRAAPILARWELLARQPLRVVRRMSRDEVWTSWRREAQEHKQAARRRLRALLRPYAWQEWTRRCIKAPARPPLPKGCVHVPTGVEIFSPLSMRDMFILKRAKALWEAAFHGSRRTRALHAWMRQPRPRVSSPEPPSTALGGTTADRQDRPLPSHLHSGSKPASTPKSKGKGRKPREAGQS